MMSERGRNLVDLCGATVAAVLCYVADAPEVMVLMMVLTVAFAIASAYNVYDFVRGKKKSRHCRTMYVEIAHTGKSCFAYITDVDGNVCGKSGEALYSNKEIESDWSEVVFKGNFAQCRKFMEESL